MAALTLALAATLLLAVAWPVPSRARHHRISNYFFMRRVRAAQLRSRTPGGSGTGDPDPNRSPVQVGVSTHGPAQTVVSPPATYVAPCRCDEADAAVSPSVRHLQEGPGSSAVVPAFPRALPPSPGGRDSVVPPDSRGHRAPQTPAGAALPHRHAPRPLDLHTHQ